MLEPLRESMCNVFMVGSTNVTDLTLITTSLFNTIRPGTLNTFKATLDKTITYCLNEQINKICFMCKIISANIFVILCTIKK